MNNFLIIFLIFISTKAISQNLVYNGSFETIIQCPKTTSRLNLASGWVGWDSLSGSCDLFKHCDSTFSLDVSVPKNTFGFQFPSSGKAYIGTTCFEIGTYREFPMNKLRTPTIIEKTYNISFYTSLANKCDYAIKDIGIYLSKNQLSFDHLFADTLIPTFVNTNNYISDTMGWVKIHGTFKAIGNENYLTIGNFYINRPTNYIQVNNSNNPGSYYYIDDVAIYPVDAPIASAQCIRDTTLCHGNSISPGLTQVESQYKSEYEWLWYKVGKPDEILSSEEFPIFHPDTTTTYVLQLTDFKYDITYDTVTVKVVNCEIPTVLRVFPNPTSNNVIFEFNSTILENTSIEIYNVMGQKIKGLHYRSNKETNTIEMNLQTQSTGIYFYRVLLGNEILFNGKLIKI
jgi:hypothetical protein